jgi:hypothetical protein
MNDQALDELKVLLDNQRIVDCLYRYSRGVDRFDEELIRSAFHHDAHAGKRTIDEFVEYLRAQLPVREACQHYMMNHIIEIEGDVAHVETYFMSVMKMMEGASVAARGPAAPESSDPNEVTLLGGRYLDRFERHNGEWKIAYRTAIGEWQSIGDGSRMAAYLALGGNLKRRDRSDPSYVRPLVDSFK